MPQTLLLHCMQCVICFGILRHSFVPLMLSKGFILHKMYKIAILYFGFFLLLLLLSGVMIYAEKTSLSVIETLQYYIGSEADFIAPKTNAGLLKLILPHIFAFGLLSMVLLHFLAFTRFKQRARVLIYAVFFMQFLEIFSPFLIINGAEFFVYLKLFSLASYLILLLFILGLLVFSIAKE